jgi:hypothetical protein
MRKACHVVLLLVGLGSRALGHLVPLDPSTCPAAIALSVPDKALAAIVAPPATDERLRVVYTPESNPERSRMQVCYADPTPGASRCGSVVARAFTLGALTGTLTFPSTFDLRLLASGEITAASVPVTIDTGGGPVAVPFAFTSAFVTRGATLDVGSPLGADGRFGIVGVGQSAALPSPLGDAGLVLDLGCSLEPPPDLDQFAQGPRIVKVRGVSSSKRLRLVVGIEAPIREPPVFAGVPARLVLRDASGVIASVAIPSGLASSGKRRHAGQAADGATFVLREIPRKTSRAYRVKIESPPLAAGAEPVTVAIETGGLFARRAVVRKAKRVVAAP